MTTSSDRMRARAEIMRAEMLVREAAMRALRGWLPELQDAVLYGTAPVVAATNSGPERQLSINTDAGEITRKSWDAKVDVMIATITHKVWATQYRAANGPEKSMGARLDRYGHKIGTKLRAIADEVFRNLRTLVTEATHQGYSAEKTATLIRAELNPRGDQWAIRANRISVTEAVAAYNAGALAGHTESARVSGRTLFKEWMATNDNHVRHTHAAAEGQKVPIGGKFEVGGFAADHPGDPELPPQEAIGCRCTVRYGTASELGLVAAIGDEMPWHVGAIGSGGCPAGKYPVVKDATGETVACHDTRAKAEAQIRLLYAKEKPMTDETAAVAPEVLPNGWRGVMAPLGRPTGDERQLNVPDGGVRTRELPITFRFAPEALGGHDGAVMAGRIDYVWVEGDLLMGEGALDVNGDAGAEYARRLAEGFAYTVSVDPDQVTFEQQFFNADGEQVPFNEAVIQGDGEPHLQDGYSVRDVMIDWRLAGVTAVDIPAFDEARIEPVYDYVPRTNYAAVPTEDVPTYAEALGNLLAYEGDDEADLAELARMMKCAVHHQTTYDSSEDDSMIASVTGATSLPVADPATAWDGGGAGGRILDAATDKNGKINVSKASRGFLWHDNDGKNRTDYKFPFADVKNGTLTIIPRGVSAAAGRLGGAKGVDKGAIQKKICSLYGKIKKSFKDWPDCPFTAESALLAAAAASGQIFTSEFFSDPQFTGPTALTVDENGHVYGHVATWGSCYMAFGAGSDKACISVPYSNTDYARFRVHGAKMDDGTTMAVGAITFGDGHRTAGGLRASSKLYADVASIAAKVAVGEDEFGIWVSGEVVDAFRDQAFDLLLSPLSGHWEPDLDVNGNLEMLAAHVVTTPGFKVPRLVASIDDDGNYTAIQIAGPAREFHDAPVEDDALVAAILIDRKAQRALRKLGLDLESRAQAALARMGVQS